ncbi:hypothetical protein [Nocardiopsis sp. JB363]|uniref:hypothetical protein n=1 Tax=Nocardiopsis sp. JB363 TaxID=1434837 RepID=UPI000B34E106|nr:hypothetical protein [Nocardiopsis sp. JB363]
MSKPLTSLEPLATFCGNCNCGCPQLWFDQDAPLEKKVVLTDDFGQRVQMSQDQFQDLIEQARSGALDGFAHPEGASLP